MNRRDIVLIGGGEHARVLGEAVMSRSDLFSLRGFVDPAGCEETTRRLGIPRLGSDDQLSLHGDAFGIIAVGPIQAVELRKQLVARAAGSIADWAAIVHARAWISPTAIIEHGAAIMAGAIVQSGAIVGAHCVINTGAIIEHDATVGAFAHVAPGAVVGGGTHIGEGTTIALGARLRDHIRIGRSAFVPMGYVLTHDLEDGTVLTRSKEP